MGAPQDLYYAKTHEWLRMDDDTATVGITDFAQNQLSDLTFVESTWISKTHRSW